MGPRPWNQINTECDITGAEPAGIECLEAVFANVIGAMVSLVGIALFAMLVYGGFTYLTAGADMKKAEKARSTMMWAIIGIVVMISSYIILLLIEQFTGVPVTRFEIPKFDPTLPTP